MTKKDKLILKNGRYELKSNNYVLISGNRKINAIKLERELSEEEAQELVRNALFKSPDMFYILQKYIREKKTAYYCSEHERWHKPNTKIWGNDILNANIDFFDDEIKKEIKEMELNYINDWIQKLQFSLAEYITYYQIINNVMINEISLRNLASHIISYQVEIDNLKKQINDYDNETETLKKKYDELMEKYKIYNDYEKNYKVYQKEIRELAKMKDRDKESQKRFDELSRIRRIHRRYRKYELQSDILKLKESFKFRKSKERLIERLQVLLHPINILKKRREKRIGDFIKDLSIGGIEYQKKQLKEKGVTYFKKNVIDTINIMNNKIEKIKKDILDLMKKEENQIPFEIKYEMKF